MSVTAVSGVSGPASGDVAPVEPTPRTAPLVLQPRAAAFTFPGGPQGQVAEPPVSKPDVQQVREAVDTLNRALSALDTQARFMVNEELNQIVVQVLNIKTNEVIRQIPPQQVLDAVASMLRLVGLLVDGKG
ncbi:MAG: flagellar protein FlaG [Armatimonadota bacterium]